MPRSAAMTVVAFRLGLLAFVLAVWEIAGRMVNPLLAVPPSAVLPALRDLLLLRSYPNLPASLWLTVREITTAYALAVAAGLATGLALGMYRLAGRVWGRCWPPSTRSPRSSGIHPSCS